MKKAQLSVVLDSDRVDTIDILARYRGFSRSAMIDDLLRRGLKKLTTLETMALEEEHFKRRKGDA